jgi:hypothetical protein
LAALAPYPVVATQGHVITVPDLAATLVVEATIHHLDMIAELPAAPGPPAVGLAFVRAGFPGRLIHVAIIIKRARPATGCRT